MRLASIIFAIGAAAGFKDVAHVGDSLTLVRSIDAPPEGLIIGGGLLMLAALLRRGLTAASK